MSELGEQENPAIEERERIGKQIREKFIDLLREAGERREKPHPKNRLKKALSRVTGENFGNYYLKELQVDEVGRVKIWSSSDDLEKALVFISFNQSSIRVPYIGEYTKHTRWLGFNGTYGTLNFDIYPSGHVEQHIGRLSPHDFDNPPFVIPDVTFFPPGHAKYPASLEATKDLNRIADLCKQLPHQS